MVGLVIFPLVFTGAILLAGLATDIPITYKTCLICSLAMPLGLNTIVIPAAYGKDTTAASGMALISHALSVVTIPLLFSFLF